MSLIRLILQCDQKPTPVEWEDTSVSFKVHFSYKAKIESIKINGLKSAYFDEYSRLPITVKLRDNQGNESGSVQIEDTTDVELTLHAEYEANTTVTFTFFSVESGKKLSVDGGVQSEIKAGTIKDLGAEMPLQQNVPLFLMNYVIDAELWLLQKGVNDDYPFFPELATRHPMVNSTKWLLQQNVNDNYPFLDKLAVRYPNITISNWYYNGKNCVVYLNSKEVSTFLNGKE